MVAALPGDFSGGGNDADDLFGDDFATMDGSEDSAKAAFEAVLGGTAASGNGPFGP